MSSLTQTLEEMVSPDLLERIAGKFGVGKNAIKGGVVALASNLVGGLSHKSNDPQSMGKLTELMNQSPDEPADMNRMIDDENSPMRQRGNELLSMATDDRPGLISQVSRTMGIGSGAATGLIGTVAAFVMGALRKLGKGRNLDASAIGSMLHTEAASLAQTAKTTVAGGAERVTAAGRAASEVVTRPAHAAAELGVPRRRPWVLLAVITLVALGFWLFTRSRQETRPPAQAPQAPSVEARRPRPVPRPESTAFPAGSPEATLVRNLRSPAGPSDTWIMLDNVTFAAGNLTFDPSSMTQIRNISRILRAYPSAHIKIRGYSDTAGTPDASTQSRSRAENVEQALVDNGVDASRMEVAEPSAGSEEANRAVAIQVTGG
jgi:outer membrane protein OmpA-like peptidoglycan-associated protein